MTTSATPSTITPAQQLAAAEQRQTQLDGAVQQARQQLDAAAAARADVLAAAARGSTVSPDDLIAADAEVRRAQAAVELAELVQQTGGQAIDEAQRAVWQEQTSNLQSEFDTAQAAVQSAAAAFAKQLDAARQALAAVIAAQSQRAAVFNQARARNVEATRRYPGDQALQVALPMAVRSDAGQELRLVSWSLHQGYQVGLPDALPQ
ncbi:hypothetical protein [Thiomonas bhubaneswarensis]|uniref:Uncharacterized protein n=1 Tax=Thiomonas bhubaneswarensis TaxID=339866 RepID=A0A0K6I5U7_9BURK|nr:hypothetical protein [Thiomonas bhubaneswarensis]CUA98466.1 hypothetical protein Ga0061069_107113 [Thiomonas bhubaneswarensis]